MSGKTLTWLMRANKVTIRQLAGRLGFPMKRIRLRRETGLRDPHACRDWIQAITGHDPLRGELLDTCNACQLDRLYYGR
jgi:hypothetical protein